MRAVGIKTLNSRLSQYVRLAAQGETILITDRDRVVAKLNAPLQEQSAVLADAFLADGVRKGWIQPPAIGLNDAPPSPKGLCSLNQILADIDNDRSDR